MFASAWRCGDAVASAFQDRRSDEIGPRCLVPLEHARRIGTSRCYRTLAGQLPLSGLFLRRAPTRCGLSPFPFRARKRIHRLRFFCAFPLLRTPPCAVRDARAPAAHASQAARRASATSLSCSAHVRAPPRRQHLPHIDRRGRYADCVEVESNETEQEENHESADHRHCVRHRAGSLRPWLLYTSPSPRA